MSIYKAIVYENKNTKIKKYVYITLRYAYIYVYRNLNGIDTRSYKIAKNQYR